MDKTDSDRVRYVKIISSNNKEWYSDKIGQTFKVRNNDSKKVRSTYYNLLDDNDVIILGKIIAVRDTLEGNRILKLSKIKQRIHEAS